MKLNKRVIKVIKTVLVTIIICINSIIIIPTSTQESYINASEFKPAEEITINPCEFHFVDSNTINNN